MKLLGAFFQEGAEEASPPADTRAIDRCRRGLDGCFPAHRGTRTMVTRVERCRCATNDSDVSWRGTEWSGNLPCCARSGIVDSLRRRPQLEGWTASSSSNLISKIDPFAKKFYSSSFWFRKNHGFGSLISDFSLHWNLFQRNRTFVNLKSLIISIFDSETEE